MTPLKIHFTGLELDPIVLLSRVHHGIIPAEWHRYRFFNHTSVMMINQWLALHIEGQWAIYMTYVKQEREVTIAFERDSDGVLFVLADGPRECGTLAK